MNTWLIVLICIVVLIIGVILFTVIGALGISSQISRKEENDSLYDNDKYR